MEPLPVNGIYMERGLLRVLASKKPDKNTKAAETPQTAA
jgi:hypothetical protein